MQSHFTVVSGTDDNAYGQALARVLAINNVDLALNNADSFEYFAENDPFLARL
jgi:peptidyl-Lys metalloendopeptidase